MSLAAPNESPWPWMPPDMDDADKAAFAGQYPADPHMAAAVAWEAWGTQEMTNTTGLQSVSTGVQSTTLDARGAAAGAFTRADWHRARSKPYSVTVGPEMTELAREEA